MLRFPLLFLLFLAVPVTLSAGAEKEAEPQPVVNPKPAGLWVMEFMEEAEAKDIPPALLEQAFSDFFPIERIVELDRKQPEGTKTFTEYLAAAVPTSRVAEGRRLRAKNTIILERIGKKYGVQPRFIIALWGIETSYGKNTGGFSVPHALATLAYEGRRAQFFREELLHAFRILKEGHISLAAMRGSWAGAMGQSQFMPSSFLRFAVDENGDGKRDIWTTQEDVFASIAHYLKESGWDASLTWGRKAQLPSSFDASLAVIDRFRPMEEWRKLGVRGENGVDLPRCDAEAALMFPGAPEEGAYLIYRNASVLLKWNRSRYFLTAVGTLADAVGGR